MSSSLAAQLSQIAARSTNELDLKAQRLAHSQSLIFDRKVASTQDFDTLHQICYEGFQELCLVDPRFAQFDRTIFSEQSKAEDRTQMTATQNKELDTVLETFLALVGERLQLSPAVKAVEWLVRRFRIHEYNTAFTILTFLPYHTTPLFLNLLSILPEDLTPTFKVLSPYKKSLINPPRHPLVHSATTNKPFFAALNSYVVRVSRQHAHHHALVAFWACIVTEAVTGMLDSSRSGRREAEKQKHEDILLRILPVLNDAFQMKYASELIIGSYMITVILAQKCALEDEVLDGLMEAVAGSWSQDTVAAGLVCLSVLAQQKTQAVLPRKVFKAILGLETSAQRLAEIAAQYEASQFLLAIVAACLEGLAKHKDNKRLELVVQIIEGRMLGEPGMVNAMATILKAVAGHHSQGGLPAGAQARLSELVQQVSRSSDLQPVLHKALAASSIDVSVLEQNLQAVIEPLPATQAIECEQMEDVVVENDTGAFASVMESLRGKTLFEDSFLSKQSIPEFDNLAQAFAMAVPSQESMESFVVLSILGKDFAFNKPQFLSFFARLSTGSHPITSRIAAINVIKACLAASPENTDFQALLPFVLVNLADPSERVRRETSELLSAIGSVYKKADKGNESSKPWAWDHIYGETGLSKDIAWLPSRDMRKVLDRALLPELEEYILDSNHISKVLERTLRGSLAVDDSKGTELKKSLRSSFFGYLCSQIVHLPLFTVKLGVLRLISRVDKVSGTTQTKELQPLLEAWRSLSSNQAQEICDREKLPVREVEQQIVATITPKEKDALIILLSYVSPGSASLRSTFISAIVNRMREVWHKVPEDRQFTVSDRLLDIALGLSTGDLALSNHIRDLLRGVKLTGAILKHFLQKIPASLTEMEVLGPAPKRRRTSQNNMVAMTVKDEAGLNKVVEKMTFILELVDSSSPETHPELADGLFQTLAAIHHFKSQVHSGMSYLLSLALGSLLAIVTKSKASAKPLFDTSVIRADLVVDCVRTTESPQVQNAALLVVAGLSVVAPEVVLHSVMPIFTFIGSNVLRKDDEYSVSVIDQTIDQVIPALIQSLRNHKRDIVSGTSELLLSFTAAFEHIPSHRRLRLFHALITKLGTQDFLFAVLAMLANRYALDKDALTLMTALVSDASAPVELATYSKYLGLVTDSFKPKPAISQVLLGIGSDDGREPQKVAVDLLRALAHLFRQSSLKAKMAKTFAGNDEKESSEIRTYFSRILEQLLGLADTVKDMNAVIYAGGEVLNALFGTLSLIDFLDTIEVLLKRPDEELRRKILQLLTHRLEQNPEQDGASQNRMLDFLPTLVHIIKSSADPVLKNSAITCIDKIASKYGKKDPSRVVEAATVVAGKDCIGQANERIQISGVYCLAAMAPVLGQSMIPVLPAALNQSLSLLDASLEEGKENVSVHNAVYILLDALFESLPFMMSASYLDKILLASFKSASSELSDSDPDVDDQRREPLKKMARKVDMTATLGAIDRNWRQAVEAGPAATLEVLDLLGLAIDKHPKSATVKNVGLLTGLLFKAFDLRRDQVPLGDKAGFDLSNLDDVEETINEVAIKMIYKLNDTTFRPIFAKMVDWATTGLPKKDARGKALRLTTFFKFLQEFFGTLKSIVTGYASFITESVVEVLNAVRPFDKQSKTLWLATVRLLRNAFEHDQDEFWQSPTHLAMISKPLIAQLAHATNPSSASLVIEEVVPAITELAVAADSTDNHKELNTALMKLLRPSPASSSSSSSRLLSAKSAGGENPHTRFAALKAEQALTEQLGEEWLALLPEMLPYISELMEDEDESVEREVRKWVKQIENVLGERLDDMLT